MICVTQECHFLIPFLNFYNLFLSFSLLLLLPISIFYSRFISLLFQILADANTTNSSSSVGSAQIERPLCSSTGAGDVFSVYDQQLLKYGNESSSNPLSWSSLFQGILSSKSAEESFLEYINDTLESVSSKTQPRQTCSFKSS